MSSIPKYELSTKYTYIGAAMSYGIREIIETDYIIDNKIPINVLKDATELFDSAIRVINDIPPSTREAVSWSMLSDHLRLANQEYRNVDRGLINKKIRSLASLVDNLGKLREIPEDQKEDCETLQKLFRLISETGEKEVCEKQTSGRYTGRYEYISGD
jgi:hypothetical protein